MVTKTTRCPCGSNKNNPDCCGRYLDGGEAAPTAEALMRSRYTAYTLGREDYLLATWHHSTHPASLDLATEPRSKWLALEVKRPKKPKQIELRRFMCEPKYLSVTMTHQIGLLLYVKFLPTHGVL